MRMGTITVILHERVQNTVSYWYCYTVMCDMNACHV